MRSVARRLSGWHIPVGGVLRPIFGSLFVLHVAFRESLIFLARFFWYEPLFRSQCEQVGAHLEIEKLPYIMGVGRIVVGSNVRLSGKSSIGFSGRHQLKPELVIGDSTFVGHNCTFTVARSIRIGKHCLLAGGLRMSDSDGHPVDSQQRRLNAALEDSQVKEIVIGDDVWIGAGAYILKGVHIGDRAIIGAGSVVTRDIPSDSVAAGNPARVLKSLTD